MLANPVVLPEYANPLVWSLAAIAMLAEIRTEVGMLRRLGWTADVWPSLLLVNGMTWLAFLIGIDRLGDGVLPIAWTVALLEAAVVVVEALSIWWSLRLRASAGAGPALSLAAAFAVSALGNLVSIAASIALPAAFFVILYAVAPG